MEEISPDFDFFALCSLMIRNCLSCNKIVDDAQGGCLNYKVQKNLKYRQVFKLMQKFETDRPKVVCGVFPNPMKVALESI